jgi:hypothetical protein
MVFHPDKASCEPSKAMKQHEWMTCTHVGQMRRFLKARASERKLRLFACACCRRVWHLLADEASRRAIEDAERYADGKIRAKELQAARAGALAASAPYADSAALPDLVVGAAALASVHTTHRGCRYSLHAAGAALTAVYFATAALTAVYFATGGYLGCLLDGMRASDVLHTLEMTAQAALFRCIFGDPFRPVTLVPAWLTWRDGLARQLAQAVYDDRHLPDGTLDNNGQTVLADALEEAGCTDADLLSHLRGPGPHVRGCWVLDAILGKS